MHQQQQTQQHLLDPYQRTMYSSTPSKSLTTTSSGAYSLDSQPYSLPNSQNQPQYHQQQQQYHYQQHHENQPLSLSERDNYERTISQLALENEELKTELGIINDNLNLLSQENEQLHKTIQEKDTIQIEMNKQLEIVTKTANALYLKIREFKCRFYERQSSWGSNA